jgi:nicotinic acid mononucleotide adenylyltransferase
MKKRMEAARHRAEQARLALATDPNITPADLSRIGQMVFTAETIEDGNVKAYVELVKLQLQAAKQDIEMRKLKMLEAKAARLDEMEAKAKELKQGGGLSAETLEMLEKQLKIL